MRSQTVNITPVENGSHTGYITPNNKLQKFVPKKIDLTNKDYSAQYRFIRKQIIRLPFNQIGN